jgi:hypothetical protein
MLLRRLQPQLQMLLQLKRALKEGMGADVISNNVAGAPASWLLPVSDVQPLVGPTSSAEVEWQLDVADIRRAVQDSYSQQRRIELKAPSCCLLGGVAWEMYLPIRWDASKAGSTVGLYVRTKLPAGTFCLCMYSLVCVGVAAVERSHLFGPSNGARDFFELGCMSGGFDEAAWAAKGLPASGTILLRLTVKDVRV